MLIKYETSYEIIQGFDSVLAVVYLKIEGQKITFAEMVFRNDISAAQWAQSTIAEIEFVRAK